ncbi:DNA replication and repair protein RecF [Eggerthellaceae bacterium zg-887]|uniref:DNA replication/repair protein RecF n=1 Tax=Xiamenia xianingshaonis TaxID=2682776 RepID=UPI00140D7921|nr:DNA replication and repair protein RecF [Xiamenia xianingshaonis]NHM16408.1 DNA replication and repair protein RecF [Xiamenia xianingshaonis]
MDNLALMRLEFVDFRNYERFSLDDIGPLTVLVGPNAVGKTNVVEGVSLLTAQGSFRHPLMSQLVRQGATHARLKALAVSGSRRLDLDISIAEGKKVHRLNGKAKPASELRGLMPSVAFTPDDLFLAKKAGALRRRALDDLGSQLSANHYLIRRDYEKLLQHKNKALKEGADPLLVASLNEMLATVGSTLEAYRRALFSRLLAAMAERYAQLTGGHEALSGRYVPSWESGEEPAPADLPDRDEAKARFEKALERRLPEELRRGRSLVGPHADRVELFVAGLAVEDFASQGQQRSVVLAWKLAEVALVQEILHQQPILLLDDVMSELDAARRRALIDFLADDIQTFVTTTNLSYFDDDLLARARVVDLAASSPVLPSRPVSAESALKSQETAEFHSSDV